jgi:peptidoglycan hydrolase CwlO-like protein
MTVESLMNTFTKYVSWLYSQREWARWELLTIALTVTVLLLFILVNRRRAKARRIPAKQIEKKPSTIGINLDAGKGAHKGFESVSDGSTIVSVSKNNGNQKRWKETTKKWKNLQKLIEQLQEETAKYKQAEENLETQFARLKAANEQLRREIAGSDLIIQEPELSQPRTIGSFAKKQNRILDPSGALAEDS